jgi:hypothetical protein
MNLGNLDKIGGKVKSSVEHPPEFLDSLSSSISGNPLISGMMNMGTGGAGLSFPSGLPKGDPLDLKPVALTSIFKSVKKGVQTGVTAAVKAGKANPVLTG